MRENQVNVNLNISGLLLIAFIVLKLTKTINWSWWWVLSPIWIPIILSLICYMILKLIDVFE